MWVLGQVLCPEALRFFTLSPQTVGTSCPLPAGLPQTVLLSSSSLPPRHPIHPLGFQVGVPSTPPPPSVPSWPCGLPIPHPGKWANNIHHLSPEVRRENLVCLKRP